MFVDPILLIRTATKINYGNGYSSHVLSVEQLQHNRKQDLKDKADAEARRLERELENTTLNKFVKNVESRIYATLSKQMVDAVINQAEKNKREKKMTY